MADFDETDLQLTLTHWANDLAVGPAPVEAIVREGGRLRRRRTITRAALSLVVAGAMASGLVLVQSAVRGPSAATPAESGPSTEGPAEEGPAPAGPATGPTGTGATGRAQQSQAAAAKQEFKPVQGMPTVPADEP
ncbi:hypothetical protein [Kitasatospora sp. GP82]|uniref:hypothetical protein n=1 Tax=Kitasatospora sp. GP82 TaxID=3035089 RepID=UPI002476E1D4|nr:hypothetical protein [Kitasatospora sp. GP82]MDH6125746.1 hypothetical protein [Kitasatospora sp. GP82]